MKVGPPASSRAARLGTEVPTSQVDMTRVPVQRPCLQAGNGMKVLLACRAPMLAEREGTAKTSVRTDDRGLATCAARPVAHVAVSIRTAGDSIPSFSRLVLHADACEDNAPAHAHRS
jgi:hypothetical protein